MSIIYYYFLRGISWQIKMNEESILIAMRSVWNEWWMNERRRESRPVCALWNFLEAMYGWYQGWVQLLCEWMLR